MTTAVSDNLSSTAGTKSATTVRRRGPVSSPRPAAPRETARLTPVVSAKTEFADQEQPAARAAEVPVNPPVAKPVRGRRSTREHLMRGLLVLAGIASVGLAWLGAIVPGLPTTIFLIIAVGCFSRSCPWLEERLIRNRFFAPYLKYIDGSEPMPRRVRIVVLLAMWTATLVSCAIILASSAAPWWAAAATALLAVIGTVFVLRWRRG